MRLLQDMLSNLMRGTMGLSAFGRKHVSDLSSEPEQAVTAVLSATGEVSSLVYAENLLNVIETLDDVELVKLLCHLLDTHDINAQALTNAAASYATSPSIEGIDIIANMAEPRWAELFRRLNATTNGTVRLVHFRERLRSLMRNHPDFQRIDSGSSVAQLVQPRFSCFGTNRLVNSSKYSRKNNCLRGGP